MYSEIPRSSKLQIHMFWNVTRIQGRKSWSRYRIVGDRPAETFKIPLIKKQRLKFTISMINMAVLIPIGWGWKTKQKRIWRPHGGERRGKGTHTQKQVDICAIKLCFYCFQYVILQLQKWKDMLLIISMTDTFKFIWGYNEQFEIYNALWIIFLNVG